MTFIFIASLICLFSSLSAFAQDSVRVSGTVLDEKGATLPGVSIKIDQTKRGTSSNVDGRFSITGQIGQTLIFTMVGYEPNRVLIANQNPIQVTLTPASSSLDEVVVVGYGTQKKTSLTSAVSSVNTKEINTTKNENVQNMLTGKIAGLRVTQNSSEPGSFDNSFDIRGLGSPLIIIDGVPRDNIARLDPNTIESISVLKDASAAVYGVRAANGVVLITTKKGKKGTLELNYNGTYGIQVPSRLPEPVGVADFMTLVNEKSMHNVNGGRLIYQPEDMAPYLDGSKHGYNWQEAIMRKSAPQMQHNLNATGGNDKTNYFLSLGYTSQDGLFKSDDLNYKRYNLVSNVSTKISENLTFDLSMTGTLDEKNQPYVSPWYVFRSLWYQPPTQAIYANDNPAYLNNVISGLNGVAHADASVNGYQRLNNKWFQSAATLNYQVPFIEGLNIKGMYSFDYNQAVNKKYQLEYDLYNYNASNDTYAPVPNQSPSTIRREFYEYPSHLARLSLNYDHTFLNTHHVSALLLYEESVRNADNFYAQRELALPIDQLIAGNSLNQQGSMDGNLLYKKANAAYVGRLTYDYKSKYLAEFSFRNDGSSLFNTGRQWGFFPAASLGWRLSEENFFRNTAALSFISNLKFRASYGKTGDDSASSYQFITGYTYPASGSATALPKGAVFDGNFVNAVQSKGLPNPMITWYTSETFDAGVDMELWKGLLSFTFDYFQRNRSGLLTTRLLSLPDVVGANLPEENLNGDRTRGFDFDITHRNRIGEFSYNLKGTFGYTRTMNTTIVQAKAGNSYLNWLNNESNRYNNIYWGYGSTGQFENWGAIAGSDIYVNRNTVVGDYRYEDWNGDGNISVDDSHPIALISNDDRKPIIPLITFGLNVGGAYKGFDFNLLFQGAAQVDVSYVEQLNTPLWAGGGALFQFLDRYRPVNPTADPYDPNTEWIPGYYAYTGTVPYSNTLANIHSAAYVRLKSADIGYTFPNKLLSQIGLKGLRVFLSGYNIATITGLKYMDPEHPSSQYGYLYPLDKKYLFGLNIKF